MGLSSKYRGFKATELELAGSNPGVTPCFELNRYVRKGMAFQPFWSEIGLHFGYFGLKWSTVLELSS